NDLSSWKEYWDDTTIHFIGKDIIYHHAIFWTSLLDGYGCKLPTNIIAGEYLSLEGRKMSTSQNWVIWVEDFVKKYDSDLLRYYLTINAPLNKDTDFSWDDFQRRINDELADVLGNFLHRSFVFTHKFFDGKVPAFENPSSDDLEFKNKIENISDTVGNLIEEFKFREGLVEIIKIAKAGNKYFNDKEPWKAVKENKESAANCIHLCTQLSKKLAIMLIPYIPKKANDILDILSISNLNADSNIINNPDYYQWSENKQNILNNISWNEINEPLNVGHEIKKAKPLFEKIEDDVIAKEKELLYKNLENQISSTNNATDNNNNNNDNDGNKESNKESNKNINEKSENMKDTIDINDFMKLDIRIGEIIEAESVEKSEKLLKLKVNIGEKEIQVVAGIAKKYSPDDLLNRQVVVLVNLKPAKLFGIKSEGMLLATDSASLLKADEGNIGEQVG
ncbi:MAG: methionine--tRNA ligase subunit beta, partial [Methanobacteriaceae archaeon]